MDSRLEKNSSAVRKRIEQHTFQDEEGEEYEGSRFGGFTDYFRRKKIKLQNLDVELRTQSSDKPKIFRGIVCHVNGYTQPSLNDIHHLIVAHGGGFMQYLDGKTTVTHIIASTLTPKKAVEFRKYRIVKPAWIVDSVEAGKLLPWHTYRVVDEGARQKVLGFDDGKVVTQINHKPRGYRDQTDSSWYTGQLAQKQRRSGVELETQDGPTHAVLDEGAARAEEDHGDIDSDSVTSPHMRLADAEATAELTSSLQEELRRELQNLDEVGVRSEAVSAASDAGEVIPGELEYDQPGPQLARSPQEENANSDFADMKESPQSERKLKSAIQEPHFKNSNMTAEEHNAVLLADPRIRKSSVLNPEFLEQYYRESRLHHLSTWKADLKAQLQAITAEQTLSQKARQKRSPGARRYILHVDFDSFFIAVSLKRHPELADTPACVAHGAGPNSEIASCNYPARKFGVKNGMWMKRAQEFCKDLKVLPYDFPAYEEASRLFYDAILETGGIVQSVSIDEALVDVSALCIEAGGSDGTSVHEGSIWREQGKAENIAKGLRDRVKDKTGCAVSVGIGGNILLAKVALRRAKPAGQHHVKPEDALDFIGDLEVQDLPGVAWSIGGKLEEIGVKFVKDIRDISKEKLVHLLGPKTGDKIWGYSRGIDRSEVGEVAIRKSVSAEVNWGVRFETQDQAEDFVESLCGELHRRLVKERVKGKQLTFKIMKRSADAPLMPPKHLGHGKCDTFSKSSLLGVATNAKDMIAKEAISIFRAYGFSPGELRGLGVQMTKLEALKSNASDDHAGSQLRLRFNRQSEPEPSALPTTNVPEKPGSQKHLQFKIKSKLPPETEGVNDPIQDDPITPQKPTSAQSLSKASTFWRIDSPGRKPLNTMGTQFMLPSQVDPQVLAELPIEIRSKLAQHMNTTKEAVESEQLPNDRPKTLFPSTILPNQSQLDMEMLNALPEDVRAEVLEHYATSPSKAKGQSRLPQSPHKTRAPPPKKGTGRGRPRAGGLLSRLKGARAPSNSNLLQTNFVANTTAQAAKPDPAESDDGTTDGEIAPDFLEALPEDIRREVMAQHRAGQLKRHAGLEVGRRRGRPVARTGEASLLSHQQNQHQIGETVVDGADGRERVLMLPPRAPGPSFTPKRLSNIEDLREAIDQWHGEFASEGPYEEDVTALGSYLEQVVIVEGDMGKAVALVKWFKWVLQQHGSPLGADGARAKWGEALLSAKRCVKDAVLRRGLGGVDMDF